MAIGAEWHSDGGARGRGFAGVHRLVEQRALIAPEATAVVDDGVETSYRDLDRRANRLARHLLALGIGPERRVGVLLERSLDMICALLAAPTPRPP